MDKQTERAVKQVRSRHEGQIRDRMHRVGDELEIMAKDLEAGRVPRGSSQNLLAAALEIMQRVAALDVNDELVNIYAVDGT